MSTAQPYFPPPPPMSPNPPRLVIIGAGSRGRAYARAITRSCNGLVVAVVEPDNYKRTHFGKTFIWGAEAPAEGACFRDWRDFISYEKQRRDRADNGYDDTPPGVDAAFVCVLDEMHREVVIELAKLGGLHIMCEKPLSISLEACVDMYGALRANKTDKGEEHVFSIGHVLRYSPANIMLRKLLLEDRVIGDVLSVVHTEPVGWWHFAHSYVRGNWRRQSTTAPSLLTKSCHDIDILLWLLCSPVSYTSGDNNTPHLPSTVSSAGSLQYFKKTRKPVAAGPATNCLSCPVESSCKYSAKRVYVEQPVHGLDAGNVRWPVSIVMPDIESYGTAEEKRAAMIAELAKDYTADTTDAEVASRNWFGRCVYESDNDVCDEQVVTVTWDDDPLPGASLPAATPEASQTVDAMGGRGSKTATFHMVAQTKRQCERFTYIYGVHGEIYADSDVIQVEDFLTGKTTTYHPPVEGEGSHGGGDIGLARQFVLAVDKVKNHGWSTERAQKEHVGCTLEEIIRSHALVFCAEEARTGKKVIDWAEWWDKEVEAKLKGTS
ncbi:NAD(P)-binding protein [Thozetella sp. PMI_491]|nr:NAD(P)-binding protein [Thozetella sp. PMI_491]